MFISVLLLDSALAAPVRITSADEALHITVDGESQGATPLSLDLPPGEHRVEARLVAGDMLAITEYIVVGDGSATLRFDWASARGEYASGSAEGGGADAREAARRKEAAEEAQRRAAEEAERLKAAREEEARIAAREAARQAARREEEEERARQEAAEEAARAKAEAEEARRLAAEEAARKKAEAEEARRLAAEEAARKKVEEAARKKAEADEARRLAAEEAARKKAEAEEARRLAAEEAARKKAEAVARAREEEERKKAEKEAARQAELAAREAQRLAQEEARRKEEEARQKARLAAARATIRVVYPVGTIDPEVRVRVAGSNGSPTELRSGEALALPLGEASATATLGDRTVEWKVTPPEDGDVERAVAKLLAEPALPSGTVTVPFAGAFGLPTGALLTTSPGETVAFLAAPEEPLAVEAQVSLPLEDAPSVALRAAPRLRAGEVVRWTIDPTLHPAVSLDASLADARAKRRKHALVTASGLGVSALAGVAGALAWGASDAAYARSLEADSQEEVELRYAEYQASWVGTLAALSTSGLALGFTGFWEFHLGAAGKKEIRTLRDDLATALETAVSPDALIAKPGSSGGAPAP